MVEYDGINRDGAEDRVRQGIKNGKRPKWKRVACRVPLSEDFIREFKDKLNWKYVSRYQILSEDFMREFKDRMNWGYISAYQILSEDFMREFKNKLDWEWLTLCQVLPGNLIRELKDKVNWGHISTYQTLSEDFIKEFKDKINWFTISVYQTLSEDFIREFKDKVSWKDVCTYQVLSEDFIREFKDEVDWQCISTYQNLSEDFIREFRDRVYWEYIAKYQYLSKSFIKEFNLTIPDNNWQYLSAKDKRQYIKDNTSFEVIDNHVIAYKTIKANCWPKHKQGSKHEGHRRHYEVGKTYRAFCDFNFKTQNSFGLSVWSKNASLDYCKKYRRVITFKVKIMIKDIGGIVHGNSKIRCRKIKILGIEKFPKK